MKLSARQKDALERIGWTTLQVAIPSIAIEFTHLPAAWIPLGTVILAVIKNVVAAHNGAPTPEGDSA